MNPFSYLRFLPRILVRRGLPVHLTFFITSRCQCRCLHCFYWKKLNRNVDSELSCSEIARFAPGIGKLLWLCITGGEPFLRDDVPEIVKIFYRYNKPRHISIVTNGMESDKVAEQLPELVKSVPGSFVHFNVSIDGLGEVHDKLRQTPGAFDRAMKTVQIVKNVRNTYRNLGLCIATTFNKLNQAQTDELSEFIRRKVAPDHWDIALVRDTPMDKEMQNVELECFLSWKRSIEGMLARKDIPYYAFPLARIARARHFVHNRVLEQYLKTRSYQFKCLAGWLSVVLYETGDVAACEQMNYAMGNIRNASYDFGKIWGGSAAEKSRRAISRSRCHCDHGCNMVVNRTFNLRSYFARI